MLFGILSVAMMGRPESLAIPWVPHPFQQLSGQEGFETSGVRWGKGGLREAGMSILGVEGPEEVV